MDVCLTGGKDEQECEEDSEDSEGPAISASSVFCPLSPSHRLVEIAPELWQCPKCGAGPRDGVRFHFWSLAYVEMLEHEAEGLAIKYSPESDTYVMSSLDWLVDDEGKVLTGSLVESFIECISTPRQKASSTLPAVSKVGSGCSLFRGMFEDPLGEKKL